MTFLLLSDDARKQLFDCELCNFSTKYSKCLENHTRKEHTEEKLSDIERAKLVDKCGKRPKSFSSNEFDPVSDRHLKKQRCSTERITTKHKSGEENAGMRTRQPPEPETPMLACPVCCLLFDKQVSLMRHMEVDHLKAFEFQCCVCSLTFGRRKILSLHLRTVHSMDVATAEEIIDEQQGDAEVDSPDQFNSRLSDVDSNDHLTFDHANGISPIKIKLLSEDIRQNGTSPHSTQRLKRKSIQNLHALSSAKEDNSNRSNRMPEDQLEAKKKEQNEGLDMMGENDSPTPQVSNLWPEVIFGTKIESQDNGNDLISIKDDFDDYESGRDLNDDNIIDPVTSDGGDDDFEPGSTKNPTKKKVSAAKSRNKRLTKSTKKVQRKSRTQGEDDKKGNKFKTYFPSVFFSSNFSIQANIYK